MISTRYSFIFLHVPKTAGNTLQRVLLPFSDDQLKVIQHQDGHDRFEITGELTRHKHSTLKDYSRVLGARLPEFRTVISIRHPFERAVSFYYSPHRWYRQDSEGNWELQSPQWDEQSFVKMFSSDGYLPMTDFLRTGDTLHRPHFTIRHETLEHDFQACTSALGLPLADLPGLQVRNRSAASDLMQKVLHSRRLRDMVEAKSEADMAFFDYASYQPRGD